ncbi:MAG: response regulator transcription factor [Treponema sp.]|jgi:DNA-binding NarL/FixJ family response regulator|nr:response regulator transcription factor [Treponema sp.]
MVRLIIAMNWEKELRHIRDILGIHADLSIIGTALDCYRVLQLVESEQPDIVVVDYYLDDIKGWDLIPIIKRKSPATSVLIISPYDDENHAWDAMCRGVSGYLVRKFDMDILASAIHMVHTGGRYISHRIVSRVLPKSRGHHEHEYYQESNSMKKEQSSGHPEILPNFSQTECQIIGFISQGKTTKEIAEILNLKTGTVRNYISRLIRKTGGRNRAQMIFSAMNCGLVES